MIYYKCELSGYAIRFLWVCSQKRNAAAELGGRGWFISNAKKLCFEGLVKHKPAYKKSGYLDVDKPAYHITPKGRALLKVIMMDVKDFKGQMENTDD